MNATHPLRQDHDSDITLDEILDHRRKAERNASSTERAYIAHWSKESCRWEDGEEAYRRQMKAPPLGLTCLEKPTISP